MDFMKHFSTVAIFGYHIKLLLIANTQPALMIIEAMHQGHHTRCITKRNFLQNTTNCKKSKESVETADPYEHKQISNMYFHVRWRAQSIAAAAVSPLVQLHFILDSYSHLENIRFWRATCKQVTS